MMKKHLAFVYILLFLTFTLTAATEYDIGGGKTLIVNDNGTYEVIESPSIDSSFLAGRQYTIDWDATVSTPLFSLLIAADPTLSMIKEDALGVIFGSYFENFGLDISIIFISADEVLAVTNVKGQVETELNEYRLGANGACYVYDADNSTLVFNDDYSSFAFSLDGIPVMMFSLVN